jgi:DNA-binding response OmpR family regulator
MSVSAQVIILDSDSAPAQHLAWRLRQLGLTAHVADIGATANDIAQLITDSASVIVVRGNSEVEVLPLIEQLQRVVASEATLVAVAPSETATVSNELEAAGADEIFRGPVYGRDLALLIGLMISRAQRGSGQKQASLIGSLGETSSVFSLLRALCAMGRSGVLSIMKGLRRGEVRFFQGEITSAQVGVTHGQAAMHQLLLDRCPF